jgi:hypothetical protein
MKPSSQRYLYALQRFLRGWAMRFFPFAFTGATAVQNLRNA